MAVYKSTYCSPLLESIDPRINSMTWDPTQTCVWLKCKVNSSNKKITGYSIRLLDADNNVIFPQGELKISPISELQSLFNDPNINSGLNGTMLYIPFFQNLENKVLSSHNALYFIPPYEANFMLDMESTDSEASWTYDEDSKTWISGNWGGYFNDGLASEGDIIFVFNAESGKGLYTIKYDAENQQSILQPYQDPDRNILVEGYDGYIILCGSNSGSSPRIFISHGDYHDNVFYYDSNSSSWSHTTRLGQSLWQDASGNKYNISVENDLYKWEITLYQGDGQIVSTSGPKEINYNNLSSDWYDMALTQGTILGSTNKRIQIADADGNLPSGSSTDPLVLQGRFVQMLDENSRQIAQRSSVRSYDASFGHVYPMEGDFQLNWIEQAQKVVFYKHANSEEYIGDPKEMVRLATAEGQNIPIYMASSDYQRVTDSTEIQQLLQNGGLFYYNQTDWTQENSFTYLKATTEYYNDHETTRDYTSGSHREISPTGWEYAEGGYRGYVEFTIYNQEGFPETITTAVIGPNEAPSTSVNFTIRIDHSDVNFTRGPAEAITDSSGKKLTIRTRVVTHRGNFEASLFIKYQYDQYYYKGGNPILNPDLGTTPVIDGYGVNPGDWILVKNQTNAMENGVYEVSSTAWRRASVYNTWGSFIGALFYVKQGIQNGGSNWESAAAVNGNLFNIDSATSGSSPLLFKKETPILLFGDKVKYGVELVGGFTVTASGDHFVTPTVMLDGIPFSEGYHILNSNNHIIYVVDEFDELNNAILSQYAVTEENDFISVNAGETYGHEVVKIVLNESTYSVIITTELDEALIQKNTISKTYVSPFVGMQPMMSLKLLNGKSVQFANSAELTNWILIKDVDTTLWCITHENLATPLLSASISDSSIPYKYELRSYFKTSDENPFYCYEKPFITLEVNGDPYIIAGALETYDVIDPVLQETVEYLVDTDDPYNVVVEGNLTISDRKITLTGLYNQFQQLSWESYRWILVDQNGETIQDTGLRYDKEMTVTFYGLEDKKQYAAILYVRDDANNLLTLIVYFGVEYPENIPTSGLNFDAEFDCSTHSVVLNFGGYSYTAPSVDNEVTQITYKYVADNIDAPGFYWDSSYNTLDNQLEIYDVINYDRSNNPQPLPLVDIYAPIGETLEYTGLSYSVAEGLNVSHSFKYDELSVSSDENQFSIDGNELYLETQVKLTENYCGKFVSFELGDDNPQNSVQIELLVPEVFTSDSHLATNMSSDRGLIQLKISKNGAPPKEAFLLQNNSNFINYDTNNTNTKFIIQHPGDLFDTIDHANEYHNYSIRVVRNVTRYLGKLWYKKETAGNHVYYLNSHYNLGNLGLTRSDDGPVGPVYWAENRGTLIYIRDSEFSLYKENDATEGGINLTSSDVTGDGNKISDPEYMPKWPSDESSFYWNEDGLSDDSAMNPDYWDDVPGFDLSGTENPSALYRYTIRPSLPYSKMSENSYIVSCSISDIEMLKSSFTSLVFGSLGGDKIGLKGTLNGAEIISILLTKTEGGN